jgi:hypothetical protein
VAGTKIDKLIGLIKSHDRKMTDRKIVFCIITAIVLFKGKSGQTPGWGNRNLDSTLTGWNPTFGQ